MEDVYLSDTVDRSTIFVSTLSYRTYRRNGGQGLGGAEGYFVCVQSDEEPSAGIEILAKAASADAARMIFTALVSDLRRRIAV